MTEDQKSIAERAEYHKGNLKDLTKDEIVHFLLALLATKEALIADLRAALAKLQPARGPCVMPKELRALKGAQAYLRRDGHNCFV